MPEVLVPVDLLVMWGVALAFCLLAVYITKALFGTANSLVGWIPLFGKVATHSLTSIEQKIVSFLSQAVAKCDAEFGASLHECARLVDWVGREIRSHANLLATLGSYMLGFAPIAHVIQLLRPFYSRLHALEKATTHAISHVLDLEHRTARGIGEDVLPRIRGLDREVGRVVAKDLRGIRAKEAELEHGAISTWKWIRSHPLAAASSAFTLAVAAALARLGVDWIRCDNAKSFFKRRGCNAWNELEALLAVGAVLGTLSLVELAEEEQAVISAVASGVRDVLEV